ncbi:hypothetical protein DY000_02041636 [Brassica cretica]|uniref:TFIIS N-terminal domain-containing protein n=1 Tax=Brassica cretica TaxID=69181 RepID=A0ABQ7BS54_BRACR|nr:hypothetical protein DY000_02041636 [Brassica cretica]
MASVDENLGMKSLLSVSKMISDQLDHSGMKSLLSLIDALNNERITLSALSKSVVLLFHKHSNTEGEIRGCNVSAVRAKVDDEKPKRSGARIRIRVKIDENPKEDLSEGKKRRIIHSEPATERSLKKARTSRRLLERVTPNYKLICDTRHLQSGEQRATNNISYNKSPYTQLHSPKAQIKIRIKSPVAPNPSKYHILICLTCKGQMRGE